MTSKARLQRLLEWTERSLGSPLAEELFRQEHLSLVVGARLADGRAVVVKSRPWHPRLAACFEAQQRAFAAGFPCPKPLVAPVDDHGLAVSAESFVEAEARLGPHPRAPELAAAALVRMIRAVAGGRPDPRLDPPPPWLWWDHPGALWPPPDDRPGDLNELADPPWLDTAGARVKEVLADPSLRATAVVGHGDWEDHNLRFDGDELVAVHDWDSVVTRPEAALAGAASAVFSATGEPLSEPTVEASEEFLAAFERERRAPFTGAEVRAAWAAGLWVRSFNAKKDALADPRSYVVESFERECSERLARVEGA